MYDFKNYIVLIVVIISLILVVTNRDFKKNNYKCKVIEKINVVGSYGFHNYPIFYSKLEEVETNFYLLLEEVKTKKKFYLCVNKTECILRNKGEILDFETRKVDLKHGDNFFEYFIYYTEIIILSISSMILLIKIIF